MIIALQYFNHFEKTNLINNDAIYVASKNVHYKRTSNILS